MSRKKTAVLPANLKAVSQFESVKDKAELKRISRTLKDAAAGKTVSPRRLERAQKFLLSFLEELNSRRPSKQIFCGGRHPTLKMAT